MRLTEEQEIVCKIFSKPRDTRNPFRRILRVCLAAILTKNRNGN